MIQQALRALAASAALVVAMTTASPAIPPKRGLIIIRNDSGYDATFELKTRSGQVIERGGLVPGQTFESVACCYYGGFTYHISIAHRTAERADARTISYFVTTDCRRDGIRYGFADFVIWKYGVSRTDSARDCDRP